MLYFAYGMNTNRTGMRHRCPQAISLGAAYLPGYKFRFAGPADVIKDKNHNVHGVLWELTDDCLRSLDKLEGYPFFYSRKTVEVIWQDEVFNALTYYMTPGHKNSSPSNHYFEEVYIGYYEHRVPTDQLFRARADTERKNYKTYDPLEDFYTRHSTDQFDYKYLSK